MNRTRLTCGAWILLALSAGVVSAQMGQATCGDDEKSHQFDFWIGDWEVTVDGKVAGHNSIQPILGGCVLQETWTGASGSAGSSLNFYDPQRKSWRQLWVWRNGTTIETSGQFADGKMTLEGDTLDRQGHTVHNRITWTANPDGTVRQHWQTRGGDTKPWTTSFDGLYRKMK